MRRERLSFHEQCRADEKRGTLTVIGADSRLGVCPACGTRRLIFNVHLYREPDRPIRDLCKDCVIGRAGGSEKVCLRSEAPLRRKWQRDGLLEAPPARGNRVSGRSSPGEAERSPCKELLP